MKGFHEYFVYIVECDDGRYYTGVTNNVELRVVQHNEGLDHNCYTFKRRPVKLKLYLVFKYIEDAIAWEKTIKGWNRKKKEAFMREDWDELKHLASIRYGVPKIIKDLSSKT